MAKKRSGGQPHEGDEDDSPDLQDPDLVSFFARTDPDDLAQSPAPARRAELSEAMVEGLLADVAERRPWGRRWTSESQEEREMAWRQMIESDYEAVVRVATAALSELDRATDPSSDASSEYRTAAGAWLLGLVALDHLERVAEVAGPLCEAASSIDAQHGSADVASALAGALGQLWDSCALEPLLKLASHPSPAVRVEVANALPGAAGDPPDERAISALVGLARDPDPSVRDWALFGLGHQVESDGEVVREALAEHLDDDDTEAKREAIVGLARRGDPRAVDPLLEILKSPDVDREAVVAAGRLGDERLLPALHRLRSTWGKEPAIIQAAIDRCDPIGRRQREERTNWLKRLVAGALSNVGIDAQVAVAPLTPDDIEPWLWVTFYSGDGRSDTWCWDIDLLVNERAEGEVEQAAMLVVGDITTMQSPRKGSDPEGDQTPEAD